SALGPFIIAKTVFSDEIDGFVELIREAAVLLLWQTTYVIILGLLNVETRAGPYIITNESNIPIQVGKVFGVIILTFMVPAISRKYANHLGTGLVPHWLALFGMHMGINVVHRLSHSLGRVAHVGHFAHLSHAVGHRVREHFPLHSRPAEH